MTSDVTAQSPWQLPPIEDCLSVRNGRTGERRTLDELLTELANADVVFLGETHDDDTTHRFEWAVFQGLLERKDSKVVLAMEMFERDVQPQLDDYLAGQIDEAELLNAVGEWGNYREAYRPMIERAKKSGAPVVASNFPRRLRMKLMEEGDDALERLGAERALAPRRLLPGSDIYWKRTDNEIRGHLGMTRTEDRLTSTQSLWDNSMGESCAMAIERYPGHTVLHVNGGFHTAYWDGTVAQLKQRSPKAVVRTVAIVPAQSPGSSKWVGAPVADFVVFAETFATNLNEERWSVYVNRKNEYVLHVPKHASADHKVPLLIWLGRDGIPAAEGLELWRPLLGDESAIAVVELPYRQQERDLSLGGRWFWPDRFFDDVYPLITTVERTWSYILSRFPIDPSRVCIAGEGSGATVAVAVTLLTDQMNVQTVAVDPRHYAKMKDIPLPLLEDWGDQAPPRRTLQIIGAASDAKWWRDELQQYDSVGLPANWFEHDSDSWTRSTQMESAIRNRLGLPTAHDRSNAKRTYILADGGAPLHLHWSRLAAQRATTDGAFCVALTTVPEGVPAERVLMKVEPEQLTGSVVPFCPGPFGGTTVLVVPEGTTEEERKAWLELQENDLLKERSMFHRLRIATMAEGENSLGEVLSRLHGEHRNNVLIVPAQFYAGEGTMRLLEQQVGGLVDLMNIHWLPGLGGRG